jgi:hypothetical protein
MGASFDRISLPMFVVISGLVRAQTLFWRTINGIVPVKDDKRHFGLG